MRTRTFAAASTAVLVFLGCGGAANAAACSSAYVAGDVFASIGNSTVGVFTPNGTSVCTLNDASGTTYTTGSGFDSSGNYYVTNFGAGTISKFDNAGTLVSSGFMTSNNVPESIVNVSVGPFAGTSFVGGPGAAIINQFNTSTGALINSYTVAGGNGTRGTDWVDFLNDHTTLLYDGEGTLIKSYSPTTMTQNADFATAPVYGYALRVIPSGVFAGDVLRADNTEADLFSSTGVLLQTYALPGDDGSDFALNLDPNGTDFWTADPSGTVWEINIATGAIDEQWSTGSSSTFGLAIFGELTTSAPPPPTTTPEPTTLALVGVGLAGITFVRRRRQDRFRTLLEGVSSRLITRDDCPCIGSTACT